MGAAATAATRPALEQIEGSLTSSAKKVFLADIQIRVVDTKIAVLDVGFLLCSLADVVNFTLALVRGVFPHRSILNHFRRERASVNAVGGGWQRGYGRCSRAGQAHGQVARAGRELGGTLRCLRVEGHDEPLLG
jgi:hypothetical protein